jgi:GntR family transcriptional regulator
MSQDISVAAADAISAAPDPLYLQVYHAITEAIGSGRLKPGDRLPTERSFCQQLGVSRATVRRAMRRLAAEGLVESTVGRGSFVSDGMFAEPPNTLMSFTELAAARGLTPSSRIVSEAVRPAAPEEARTFQIGLHELVFELERLRLIDGVPTAIDRTRIPVAIAPGLPELDFTDASIYAALEAGGAEPVTADVVVSATTAENAPAAVLCIPAGSALIVLTTMSHDTTGRLVEIDEITYRADRYQFRSVLSRRGQHSAMPSAR